MDIKKILQQIDKVNEGYRDFSDRDYPDDDDVDHDRFAQKGSALHSADKNNPRDQDCPTCGEENVLTRRDVAKGYQCDTCADRAEGKIQYESKKPSLKDYFHKIDEDATSGMKPLPMLDPKKQQVGAAVITSTNPTIQKILKNLTPQDVQVIQTMTKTGQPGQPNQSGTQTTGTNTSTSAGSMQPMKEASDSEPTVNGKVVDVYSLDFEGIDTTDYPDFSDAYIVSGSFEDGTEMSDAELEEFQDKYHDLVHTLVHDRLYEGRNATDDEHEKTLDTLMKRPDFVDTVNSLKKRDQDDKQNQKFKKRLTTKKVEQIDEAGSVHLVGKYKKGGVTHHLFQDLKDGGYSYHLTKLVNGEHVKVKNYAGYSMPEAQADLTRRGFGSNLLKVTKEEVEQMNEKWGTETKVAPSEQGKYKGKTKAELLKHYNKLKKSGPHKKGSKEYGTMRELSFAIRAKSGWGKVKEAERPPNQVDMGAGLGAGRSNTVLESNMKKTCQAAYHEGKSHGLGGHAYTCRHDEGTDEHMHYHNGFKEGLDECYGIEPMRGVVDETMAATVPGMASKAMKESDSYEDDESVYDDIDEDTLGAVVGGALGGYATRSVKGAMTGAQLGSAAQDEFNSVFQKEGNAFTGALAKAKKGEKFSLGGHTYTDTSDKAFESLDRKLNALLNEGSVSEGISVSISKGQQGGQDSVSITATDAEADNLLALVRNAGMGIFADEQKATSNYGAPVSDEGHADVEEHDSILGMMKKMAGIQDSHDSAQEDHSDCGCGQTPCECEEVTEDESEDQMEYEVAEDATEVAMTDADEESEAAEDQAIATADAKEDELNEWANEAGKIGTEEAFTTRDEFMLDTISGGLNKKKSTGQTTIPVIFGQADRMGYNESLKSWIQLVS